LLFPQIHYSVAFRSSQRPLVPLNFLGPQISDRALRMIPEAILHGPAFAPLHQQAYSLGV